jgi:hypothetical protein
MSRESIGAATAPSGVLQVVCIFNSLFTFYMGEFSIAGPTMKLHNTRITCSNFVFLGTSHRNIEIIKRTSLNMYFSSNESILNNMNSGSKYVCSHLKFTHR